MLFRCVNAYVCMRGSIRQLRAPIAVFALAFLICLEVDFSHQCEHGYCMHSKTQKSSTSGTNLRLGSHLCYSFADRLCWSHSNTLSKRTQRQHNVKTNFSYWQIFLDLSDKIEIKTPLNHVNFDAILFQTACLFSKHIRTMK